MDIVTVRIILTYAGCFVLVVITLITPVIVFWGLAESRTTRNERAEAARSGAYNPHKEKE